MLRPGLEALWNLAALALVNWLMARQMIKRPQDGLHKPVLLGLAALAISAFPGLLASTLEGGMQQVFLGVRQTFDVACSNFRNSSGLDAETLKSIVAIQERYLWLPFPAWFILCWLGWLSLDALLLRWWLYRSGRISNPRPLLNWAVPDWMILVFLVPAFVWLGLNRFGLDTNQNKLFVACLNVLVLVLPLYLLQGFLVALWSFLSWGVPLLVLFLAWVLVLAVLPPEFLAGLILFLTMLGLMDTWFDFRHLQPPAAPAEGSEP